MSVTGPLAYAAIYVSAIIEGEIVFIGAAVLVAAGRLNPLAVMIVGALGAATGDQMFFYAFRGRIKGWLTRYDAVAARQAAIVERVQRYQSLMILAIRFAPGLRIAIAAACAYGNVSPLRFTLLNLLGAFAWAAVLLTLVVHVGPGVLKYAGLSGIWGAIVPGVLIVLGAWLLARRSRSTSKVLSSQAQSSVR